MGTRTTTFGATLLAALLAALLVALSLGVASAQDMGNQTLQLTPSRGSGVSGTATLTDTAEGVQVALEVQGIPTADGTEHIAHIHSGATCADDRAGAGGPVEFPLQSVFNQGGSGASTTVIPGVTVATLFDGTPRYVNVHAEMMGSGVPPGVACADLVSNVAPMPNTGGFVAPATVLLLGGGATLVALVVAGAGVLARRRAS